MILTASMLKGQRGLAIEMREMRKERGIPSVILDLLDEFIKI
jgi:hypothetical protein